MIISILSFHLNLCITQANIIYFSSAAPCDMLALQDEFRNERAPSALEVIIPVIPAQRLSEDVAM